MRNINFKRYYSAIGSFLVTMAIFGNASSGFSLDKDRMTILGLTSQPIGHYRYCQKNPTDCVSNTSSPLAPELTDKKWNELVNVNSYANKFVSPVTDLELYKQEEYWTLPQKFGDCEDYVLLKRQLLIDLGWPVSSLLVTVVKQVDGEGHAVLTARTKNADFILDNLRNKILPWNRTEYRYLKRQSTLHSGRWSDIRDARDVVGAIK